MTPDQLEEALREPVKRILDESRKEERWLKECDRLREKAFLLSNAGMTNDMGESARDELRAFLIREFRPYWELTFRIAQKGKDYRATPEETAALKRALRDFYQRVSTRYPGDFADRIFEASFWGETGTRDPAELHRLVLEALE